MFGFSFKYRLKRMLRDKKSLIWSLFFPICLGTFFHLGLSGVSKPDMFIETQVAIVENEAYRTDESFKVAIKSATQDKKPLFGVTVTSKEEAEKLLESGAVAGYIELDNGPKLSIKQNSINASIIKNFLDQYERKIATYGSILSINPTVNQQQVLEDMGTHTSYINKVNPGSADFDLLANYFYALLAMSCLFASFNGAREGMDIQANLSKTGARVNVAPIQKFTLFMSGIAAVFLIQMIAFCLVLGYITLVLKVNLGPRIGYMLLTGGLSSLVGISIGAFVAVVVKGGESLKESILVTIAVGGGFLAGLMMYNMKYIVATKCPVIAYINPASLITDAFYALYYYQGLSRYFLNMGLLCLELVILWVGVYTVIRRKKYANI